MPRPDGRANDQLRPISIEIGYQKFAEGSALVRTGDTWVLCAASVEDTVPSFLTDRSVGWVTAEYAMLPRSTHTRTSRQQKGRAVEIQRLIGRALRAAIDTRALGPRTITVDCDVLQADGGTRVAAITGAYVAVALAVRTLAGRGDVAADAPILREPVAAVSVGIVGGEPRLDLPYSEDAAADVDMNVVMTRSGRLVEVQGTAERDSFTRAQLDTLLDLAGRGIERLCAVQEEALRR